ncbi:hypothetical protein LPJ78_000222 [Coemansia sp. RSA 989]|nr:hypothetical protein LPJ68_000859 [Coemansia sp. RSA 1086]KAJ1752751.1 hypothetical protein LPJ79_001007 [Coemansia sp. RSA 1821]KAJ1868284.1 hypothetical protein LPJ78_000222 [Coemansia sp. RSA 989]KAJ1875605.1 hypothetical protein LPJ55_000598 [Coemansia sp. RSA 990]KAJ2627338.1 hypothetical protein H4R22_004451 [Coemansia sp. RSA 1290]KAJ2650490.1 hypothetical protein IWW40_002453 [Coemansia sp. RSA 1250]KAJ2673111.1 hypothetical protein IWW42_002396 [Coemansia sp. RSA 1085]
MVYKYGVAQYGDSNTSLQLSQVHSLEEPANLKVSSNIDLINHTGYFKLIKHLVLRINYKYNPLYGLQNILNHLCAVSQQWHALKTLEIEIKGNRMLKEYSKACISFNQYEIQKAANWLTQLLPQVKELKFSGYKPTPVAYLIYNQLAWVYSGEIRGLHSNFPLLNPGTTDFSHLTHLEMDFDSNPNYHLPLIRANALKYLSLSNIPFDYDWLPFYGTVPETTVNFAHLKVLLLNYSESSKYQDRSIDLDSLLLESSRYGTSIMFMVRKLLFPELEYLHVGTPGIEFHPIFEHSVFPCELNRLHLDGSVGMIQSLERLKLPIINQITLNLIYDQSPDMAIAFNSINRICRYARSTSNVRLEVYNYNDIYFSAPASCPYITELDIKSSISAAQVVHLIKRLPLLGKLELSGMRFTQSDMAVFDNGGLNSISKSQIVYLSIVQGIRLQPIEEHTVVYIILYLLSKLTLLSSLKLRNLPAQPVQNFISENRATYSHLSALELNI